MRIDALVVILLAAARGAGASPKPDASNQSSAAPPSTTLATSWKPPPQLARNSSKPLSALFQPYSPDTPAFENRQLIRELSSGDPDHAKRGAAGTSPNNLHFFGKRDVPDGVCAPGQPCRNGACCSKTGVCSYEPSSCAPKNCISNCDAKAPCGKFAAPDKEKCPLNVCCSQYGFCGTKAEFCGKGCQKGYGSCGAVKRPSCGGNPASQRRIGYYESWAYDSSSRLCDLRQPTDLDLTGLSHLNFAFAFFHPKSFSISPMTNAAASLYKSFTGLKEKKQGLETWISVGGWSFNDPGNNPDTRTAFSNMASTRASRRAFISSLQNFMQTYGFDGVDIDWEYPAADDRGGVKSDTANFVQLVAEMRSTWGTSYGISATLPSSFWYLQGFDVASMQQHVDWFNVMSYDVHGVWDSSNRFEGPFIRPHTNLTEIQQGLDLLWMAGVSPAKVVLGLGFYGRSFTLADPSCNKPNGVCRFTQGGDPGRCTNSAGILSIAEIKDILGSGKAKEFYDADAAVKWMSWNNDQWVSYDDGITMQQKTQAANSLCLGGLMIWALDQDTSDGGAMSDLLGIGKANGVSDAKAREYKEQLGNATLQNAIASSCYWTLCGQQCVNGFFDVTEAKGQVASVQRNSVCSNGDIQTLCCAPGTTLGTCQWEGFRGLGLPCSPVCSDPDATIVAQNTNSLASNNLDQNLDLTCTGGYQAFCCSGFIPSSKANTGNLLLYGQGALDDKQEITARGEHSTALEPRGVTEGIVTTALCAVTLPALLAAAPFTFGLSLIEAGPMLGICATAGVVVSAVGYATKPSKPKGGFGRPRFKPPKVPTRGKPKNAKTTRGQWKIMTYTPPGRGKPCDCSVTYTCRYGLGWDEICDNQRWAITHLLNRQTVFTAGATREPHDRQSKFWERDRKSWYRKNLRTSRVPPNANCDLDEFPMAALEDSKNLNPQACRLVNNAGNRHQGADFRNWKAAVWAPCSAFRVNVCKKGVPLVTWEFNALNGNRNQGAGSHFITAYGFDSQTAGRECFAEYSFTNANNRLETATVLDHGFRALDNDPMFDPPFNWPRQNWGVNPEPKASSLHRPKDVNSARWLRRDAVTAYANDTDMEVPHGDSVARTCHADLHDLYSDSFHLENMSGEKVDRSSCDVILDEDAQATLSIQVHEDGSWDYIWVDAVNDNEKQVASVTEALIVTAPTEPPRPLQTVDLEAPMSTAQ